MYLRLKLLSFLFLAFTSLFAQEVALELTGDWFFEGGFKEQGSYPASFESIDTNQLVKESIILIGSWSGSDINKGKCISPIFVNPSILSLYISGSLYHPDCKLYLEDIYNDSIYILNVAKDYHVLPYEVFHWKLPKWWINKEVRLVAQDAAVGHGGWIGISSPFVADTINCINLHDDRLQIGSKKHQDFLNTFSPINSTSSKIKHHSIVNFLDKNPNYLLVVTFLIIFILAFYIMFEHGKIRYVILTILLFLFLFLLRLPGILHEFAMLDESQMLTQAMTLYYKDFAFWRAVDGTTGGPLLSYILILPHLLGLDFTAYSARLTGILLIVLSIYFCGLATKNIYNIDAAKIQTAMAVVIFAFLYSGPIIHYTSEHLPIFFFSLCYYMLSKILLLDFPDSKYHIFSFGFLTMLSFFTKLQVIPLIFGLNIWFIYWLFFKKLKRAYPIIVTYAIGFGLVLILLTTYLVVFDLVEPFYNMYIRNNILIKAHQVSSMVDDLEEWYLLFFQEYVYYEELGWFFRSCLVLFFLFFGLSFFYKLYSNIGITNSLPVFKKIDVNLLMTLLVLALAIFAVIRPGRTGLKEKIDWGHYLLFVILPLCMVCSALYYRGIHNINDELRRKISLVVKSVLLLLIFTKTLMYIDYRESDGRYRYKNPYIGQLQWENSSYLQKEKEILTHLNKEYESIAIWGYNYDIYTQLKLTQATRDGSDWYMGKKYSGNIPDEVTSYHRNQYLNDLKQSQPKNLIDFTNGEFKGLDANVSKYILCNYHIIYKRERSTIYLRNDLDFYSSIMK